MNPILYGGSPGSLHAAAGLGLGAAVLAMTATTVVSVVVRDPLTVILATAAALVFVTLLGVGLPSRHLPGLALGCAALTMDFAPLSLFRYFLWSDLFILIAASWLAIHGTRLSTAGLGVLFALFTVNVMSSLVSFTRAVHPDLGLFTWLHMAFIMLVYLPAVTAVLRAKPHLGGVARAALVVSGVGQAAIIVSSVAQGLHWETGTRIAGAMGNQSVWLFVTAWTGLLAMGMAGRWMRLLWVVPAFGMVAIAAGLMRSRSLWVALIVATSIYILVRVRHKMLGVLAVLGLAGIASLGYLLELYPTAIQSRIRETLTPRTSIDLVYRVDVVQRMFEPWSQNVFVGIGARQSESYLPGRMIEGRVDAVHNVVLHAAIEGGLLSGLVWLLLPAVIVRMWWDARIVHRDLADWALASLLAIYMGGQFTPTLYEHVFYFLLGVLAALRPAQEWRAGRVPEPNQPLESLTS
jgi:hypothetical protein